MFICVLPGAGTLNIGLPVSVSDYAEQEWKGDTTKARAVREVRSSAAMSRKPIVTLILSCVVVLSGMGNHAPP